MPVDGYKASSHQDILKELPVLYDKLKEQIEHPHDISKLLDKGNGQVWLRKKLLSKTELLYKDKDIKGCYVFVDGNKPIYVGISRTICQRIVQHVARSSNHNSASLAYQIAINRYCEDNNIAVDTVDKKTLSDIQNCDNRYFRKAKERLGHFCVAYIPIDNDLLLHIFEPYAAVRLQTGRYNSFRTH